MLSPLTFAADGFAAWNKSTIWGRWSFFVAVHWVEGHGWYAAGKAEMEGVDVWGDPWVGEMGAVVSSPTGVGWSGNILFAPSEDDPEGEPDLVGYPQLGLSHIGNRLVTVCPDSAYAMDFATGTWQLGFGLLGWGGGIASGDGMLVATDTFSLDGPFSTTYTSADGVNWTDTGFVSPAVPGSGSGDWGEEWGFHPRFPICHGSGRFVAASSFGWIITSTDGTTWQNARMPRAHQRVLRGVAAKGGTFVAVGDGGTILRSTNGTTWQHSETPTSEDLHAVAAGEHWFVAVGRNETVLISADGATWQPIQVDSGASPKTRYIAVGYGDGRFLITTSDGHSLLSGTEPLPVEVAVSPAGTGVALVAGRGVLAVPQGGGLDVTATAMPGYRFAGWTGGIVQQGERLTATVNAPLSLTANFVRVASQRMDFREGPPMQEPRMGHRAVTIDGRTVLFGGHTSGFTRSGTMDQGNLDAGTGELSSFGLVEMPATADGAAVAALPDGRVFVAGGAQDNLGIAPGIQTAMVVAPAGARDAGAELIELQMVRPRMNAAAATLSSGQVLVVGGWWSIGSATYGERFTLAGGGRDAECVATGPLAMPRSMPVVLPTNGGGAVVAGGWRTDLEPATRVEAYHPGTNQFTTLGESLLGDGEEWILNTHLPGGIASQRLADGSYLLSGWHRTTREGCLFLFDPNTGTFQRRALVPPLEEVGDRTFPPVLDANGTHAFLLTAIHDAVRTESQFRVHVVELATGKRATNSVPFTVSGYFSTGATLTGFEVDGTTRLLLAGGSSTADETTNFHPVARTYLFDPMLSLSTRETTTVSQDYHGFAEQADNVRMARAPDGALHFTYTRAVRAPNAPDYYSYARTRDAAGSWQPETRTERFPDSNTANSIVVDDEGRIHQGFTFNVGAFHAVSLDGGASWEPPVPVRDGGWGMWDYDTRLVRRNGDVYAVFYSCFGWNDFPANLMLRRWKATTGWGNPSWLTSLPNEDSSGYGVQAPRFQTCPDGRGVVLYTESLAALPTQVKLLDVALPHSANVPHLVSQPGRWAAAGDVAVDGDGTAHVVWREADTQDGPYELWYRTFTSAGGLGAPVQVSEEGEPSVRTATVGAYAGRRVLVAYGVQGEGTTYGGVFVRKVAAEISSRLAIAQTANAHSPGLRSTWDMDDPNTIDLTWVEVYGWGSQLLHRELGWDELAGMETAKATVRSNVPDATFTLTGPVSGEFSLVDGVLDLGDLPPGTYTIIWHAKAGQTAPPPQTFVVTGDGEVEVGASYIDENLHRVTMVTSPSGAGEVLASPAGVVLLGNDRAYADGPVTFSARPVEGQIFVRWRLTNNLGTGYWTDHPLTITIDRDFEVQAEFEEGGPFRVDTALFGDGTITPGAVVPSGSRFVCTVAPAAGQEIQSILLDGTPQPLGTELVVDPVVGNHSIHVFAEPAEASVTTVVLPEGGGEIVVSPATFAHGDTVRLEAVAAAGFRLAEWRGDAAGSDATVDLVVDGAKSVTAFFVPEGVILGDLNDDGAISIDDAVLARRMYAGQMPVDLVHADMNGNGQLDTDDILAILQAEAEGVRPCLGAQEVGQVAQKRQLTFPSGIGLTLPANWPDSTRRASVARGIASELPPLPPGLEAASPIYDIRLAGTSSFGREIGLTFPASGGARWRDDASLRVLHLDPESGDWVGTGTGVAGDTLGLGERSGKYVVAKPTGTGNVQGTHCVVYYDTKVAHKIGGASVSAFHFAEVVANHFDAVFGAYQSAGYNLPNYVRGSVDLFLTSVTLDRRADIYLSDAGNTYKEAFYSWKTKNFYIPATLGSEADIRFTLAHEMFHAIQNQVFSGPSMGANRWLMEMTAEYASRKAPYDEPLSIEYGVWLATRLGTLDDIHEYACAHLMHFLVGETGGTFLDLWNNRLAKSYTPHAALQAYVRDRTNGSLSGLYAHYLDAVLFDTAVADLAQEELTMPVNGTSWGAGNTIETTVTAPVDQAMGWMRTRKPGTAPLRVLVELPDSVPPRINARIYRAPYGSPKTDGGREPLGSFFEGETLPFAGTVLGADDSIYVTSYNYWGGAKTMAVRIRPLNLAITQTPSAAVSGTPCVFKATVDLVPDSVQELRVHWMVTDGKPWQIDTLPADTREFEHEHTFEIDEDKAFQVTFELFGLDADGRRRLIAAQTLDVGVEAKPAVEIAPVVSRVEVGQAAQFTATVKNGPDNPRFRWTFDEESPAVEENIGAAAHAYDLAGDYTVSVSLMDAAAPAVVLAQCQALVVVNAPPQVIDPGPDPDQDAPPLDYSKLRQVDQDRGFIWDDAREVFYVDAAGTKQGLYRSFLPRSDEMVPLEVGMYINGMKEGRWLVHWQDGSGRIEQRHFHNDLWVVSDSTAVEYNTIAQLSGGQVVFEGELVVPTEWPAAVAGGEWRINHLDGSYEEVAFDTAGRRHGHCVIRNAANQTLMEGDFAAGVKIGVWKYFRGGGATGVSYNHNQDPPNHE